MARLSIIFVLLVVASSCAALQVQASRHVVLPPDNIDMQERSDDKTALEVVGGSDECEYILKTKTGDKTGAGTNSKINFTFWDKNDKSFTYEVDGSKPFILRRDYLDTFEFKQKCLDRPCRLRIGSDYGGLGDPDWLCDWVSIVKVWRQGRETFSYKFKVGYWIGNEHTWSARAVNINDCGVVAPHQENI